MLFPLVADQILRWSRSGADQAFVIVLCVPFAIVGAVLVGGDLLLDAGKRAQIQAELETASTIHLRDLFSRRSLLIVTLVSLRGAADNTIYTFLPMFMESHFSRLPIAPAFALG